MLKYVQKALDAECENIRRAPLGERHNTRFKAAAAIGQLVGATWANLSADAAFQALYDAASKNTTAPLDPSSTYGRPRDKVAKAIVDGLKTGATTPRERPADLDSAESPTPTPRRRRKAAPIIQPPDSDQWRMMPDAPPAPRAGPTPRAVGYVVHWPDGVTRRYRQITDAIQRYGRDLFAFDGGKIYYYRVSERAYSPYPD